MDKIFLQGMKFYAYHGVFEEENKLGQIFVVDVELSIDLTEACATDELETTVNYGEAYQLIEEEMKESSKLLEHVAGRIAKTLFAHYNRVVALSVRITKENPPIAGHYDGVGIEINRTR
ncbi:dihydroneopterin aldolase [Macrococcus equipercicus]|uniref:7,8-dihydroneopterin aldolase n=1 Tax=Macrococcus equipercicus TaxID=69967 RepID=A0A9Q9F1B1_9STAP|nr:dihydroneopterin aldolase [Macrococcus equipercicus]KAA1036162.1 dihydroneopterin aldolase [Macrococcus equipercicus]UTH13722.1 dihydroneopterin aldolase [Macrococcus equipercicus]